MAQFLLSTWVLGSDFLFVVFLGRGVRGRGIPDRPGSTAQSLISPYSGVIYFHTYLDCEQSIFFLRTWSETGAVIQTLI